MTCKQLLPTLATEASDPLTTRYGPAQQQQQQPHLTQQLALSAMLAIVRAAVKVAYTAGGQEDAMAGTGSAVFDALTLSQRKHPQENLDIADGASSSTNGSAQNGDAELHDGIVDVQDMSLKQLAKTADSQQGPGKSNDESKAEQDERQLLRLQVLTELVSFPKPSTPLSAQVCCTQSVLVML